MGGGEGVLRVAAYFHAVALSGYIPDECIDLRVFHLWMQVQRTESL